MLACTHPAEVEWLLVARSPLSAPVVPPETLADLLVAGPLPLPACLRCASGVAAELRDLHQRNQGHGGLTAWGVILTETGAHLLPASHYWDQTIASRDVQGFGALLYLMLTGRAAPATPAVAAELEAQVPRTGPSRLRPAALKLALRCLAPKAVPLSMQQVAVEIRLLLMLLRQYETSKQGWQEGDPGATPFLVTAAPPVTPVRRRPPAAPPMSPPPVFAPLVPAQTAAKLAPPASVEPGTRPRPAARQTGSDPVVRLDLDSFGHPSPSAPVEVCTKGGSCPKCDSPTVYVSRARSPFEHFLERQNIPICRCHRCFHRYFALGEFKIGKEMPTGGERKPKRKAKRRRA